jgi:hypothetical protein
MLARAHEIAELVDIARVPADKTVEAAAWLYPRVAHLRRMRKATRTILPNDHERRLARLDKAASAFTASLENVWRSGHLEHQFLYFNFFRQFRSPKAKPDEPGPRFTRADINAAMGQVRAGIAAMQSNISRPPNRPPNIAHQMAVDVALSLFERFSKVKPSSTEGSPLVHFTSRLCEIALGTERDWGAFARHQSDAAPGEARERAPQLWY